MMTTKRGRQEGRKGFQTGNVLAISVIHCIHDIYSSFLAPILPLLIEKHGITLSMSSFLSILQRLPSLANPFIGLIADKVSFRWLLVISPSLTAIVMSCLGLAPSYFVLGVLLFVMGISASLFHVPAPVMVKNVSGNRTGMGMSFFMFGGEIARTLGPLTILGAVSIWGFDATYRLIPFAFAASFILYLKLRKVKPLHIKENTLEKESKRTVLKKYFSFFLVITVFIFITGLIKSSISFFLPTFLNSKGESLWYGGIALAVYQFAGAAGTFVSGTISDFIGRKRTLLITSAFSPLLMAMFVYFRGSIFTFPLLVLIGFFIFTSTPVILAIVNSFNTSRPAFLNGVFMAINFLGGSLAVLLIGALGDWIGLETTFYYSSIAGLVAIPVVLFFPSEK